MTRYDIVTIGSATRDVFLISKKVKVIKDESFSSGEAECFALGAKIDVDDLVFETGGGATNTAVSFARQGFRPAFIGKIGATDARGREILHALEAERVATNLVLRDEKRSTAYSVLLMTPRGERTALVYRGASSDFQPADIPWASFRTSWIYVTALGGKLPLLKAIFTQAQKRKIKIAWNPGAGELAHGLAALRPLLRLTDIIILNMDEAVTLYRQGRAQVTDVFHRLRQTVKRVAVVTLGTDGALAGTSERSWQSSTHHIHVVDTTGAGDAFGSGFVGRYIKTPADIPAALQFATANAESVVRHIGAKAGLLAHGSVDRPVTITNLTP